LGFRGDHEILFSIHLVLGALTIAACSGLLDVKDPDIINPGRAECRRRHRGL